MAEQSNVYVGVAGYFGKPDHKGKVGVFRHDASGGGSASGGGPASGSSPLRHADSMQARQAALQLASQSAATQA